MPANILIVEDSKTVRILATSALQKQGHNVLSVDSPYEIKKALASFRPDVIVLDLQLPKLNTDEAIALVKQVNPAVQIVIYSSGESHAVEAAKQHFSAKAVVKKEASFAPLIAAVSAALTQPQTAAPKELSTATTRLLLIDDDTDQHLLLTSLLCDVATIEIHCTTSALVVGMIRRLGIDVVLADVHLPGTMQGPDVVTFLRKFGMGEKCKFLLYSAKSPAELDTLAKQCGADDYIVKGQAPQQLKADIVFKLKKLGNLSK